MVNDMQIGVASDRGRKRDLDEDSLAIVQTQTVYESRVTKASLLAVADGMGGHNAGEVASKKAIEGLIAAIVPVLTKNSDQDICGVITSAIKKVNSVISTYVQMHPECQGMGTTITCGVVSGPHVHIGHVGDSRAYMITGNTIRQITKDHSLVQEMIDQGQLSVDEARTHPQKHIITRAVGVDSELMVDIYSELLYGDDILLLCCDGLTDMLTDEEIVSIVNAHTDLQAMCDALVEAANEKGGLDNISVIGGSWEELSKREQVLSDETHIKSNMKEDSDCINDQ
jgi:protein phosphatase